MLLYTNADVLTGEKKGELSDLIAKLQPHVVALTEINPKNCVNDGMTESLLSLRGYELVVPAYQEGSVRGVALLLRAGIPFRVLGVGRFRESVVVEINLKPLWPITFGVLSRSPSSREYSDLAAVMKEFFSGSGPKILVGDFNLPGVDWDLFHGGQGGLDEFFDVLIERNVLQIVRNFTRFGINQKPSLLDLCLIRNLPSPPTVEHLNPLGKSDHSVLKFLFSFEVPLNKFFMYCWKAANFEKISENHSNVKWSEIFKDKSVEESWSSFKTLAPENIKNYVPLVSVTKESSAAPWFGKKCRVALRAGQS